MLKMSCHRIRDSWERIETATIKITAQKVVMIMRQQALEHGEKIPEGIILKDRLTQQIIADMCGMNRETVTRALDKLRKDKSIPFDKYRKIILHPTFFKPIPEL